MRCQAVLQVAAYVQSALPEPILYFAEGFTSVSDFENMTSPAALMVRPPC